MAIFKIISFPLTILLLLTTNFGVSEGLSCYVCNFLVTSDPQNCKTPGPGTPTEEVPEAPQVVSYCITVTTSVNGVEGLSRSYFSYYQGDPNWTENQCEDKGAGGYPPPEGVTAKTCYCKNSNFCNKIGYGGSGGGGAIGQVVALTLPAVLALQIIVINLL